VETNIVRVSVRASGRHAAQWAEEFALRGIAVSPADSGSLRFVTHRHIGNTDVDAAISACAEIWRKR
jgi:threonine aldolase